MEKIWETWQIIPKRRRYPPPISLKKKLFHLCMITSSIIQISFVYLTLRDYKTNPDLKKLKIIMILRSKKLYYHGMMLI